MKIQNTIFRITTETIPIINRTEKEISPNKRVHTVLSGRNRDVHMSLSELRNLTSVDNLLLEIEGKNGEISEIILPEDIHLGLIRFFQKSPDIYISADCLGFVVQILGGKEKDRFIDDGDYSYHGIERILDSSCLNSGDVIAMSDGTEEGWNLCRYHYALYLGHDLFLSKLGMGGILAVNNFEQLKGIYPELNFIVKLLLKKK